MYVRRLQKEIIDTTDLLCSKGKTYEELNLFNSRILYSKTCLKRSRKIDKTKALKTNGSLMKFESIAECSLGAFCNTFDLH